MQKTSSTASAAAAKANWRKVFAVKKFLSLAKEQARQVRNHSN